MPRPRKDEPRQKRDFILRLNIPEERRANEFINSLVVQGKFSDWIRDLVLSAIPRETSSPKLQARLPNRENVKVLPDLDYVDSNE